MGYKALYKEFVDAYEKLQDVGINKTIELNIAVLKEMVIDIKEKINSINFEFKRNECLQG